MAGKKQIKDLAEKRTKLVDRLISSLEKKVGAGQEKLLKMLINDFVDSLDKDGDIIKNTLRNKRLVGFIDTLFKRFNGAEGLQAIKAVSEGVGKIIDFNADYFGTFEQPAKLEPITVGVRDSIGSWLGLGPKGGLEKNGYLDTILKDSRIKNRVKDMMLGGIVSQKGYQEMKKDLQMYIGDNPKRAGALKSYYRNFVYDTFSVADRTAAKITADKLKFNYAIFEGGIIKTTRPFCRKRNGKVFSKDEIAKMNPAKEGTNTPPGYNPFTDMGSYGCRHHWSWIPDLIAFALRPELKKTLE